MLNITNNYIFSCHITFNSPHKFHLPSLYSFFWAIPRRLNFMCRCFGTLCPIFIDGVGKKNYRHEIARVFVQVKVWLKHSLSQLERGGMGKGRVRVEKQTVEGKDPK